MKKPAFEIEFKKQSLLRLNENAPRIKKCLEMLDEEYIWRKSNSETNSIGNLILHLCGNIRQYAISSLAEKPDERDRNSEFENKHSLSKEELIQRLNSTVFEASQVIQSLTEADLLRVRPVQCFEMSGIGVIIHVVEHFSYHTGQIALLTKLAIEKDLGFYADANLTSKNQ
jgi:uncharacterized damage-inducible protein DinB